MTNPRWTPALALLTGATVWGIIWYPYRALQAAGVSAELASAATYAIALVAGLPIALRGRHSLRPTPPLLWIGLAAGWSNVGFVLAVVYGEVVRVTLLFYLAPLWTVLLSFLLLGERLDRHGVVVVALSLAGAVTMLWTPAADRKSTRLNSSH